MCDVLLVKPPSEHLVLPPLGLGYLATALRRSQVSSKILHGNKDDVDVPEVVDIVRREHIPVLGVTCCSNDHVWLLRLARALEEVPDVKLIVGGAHAAGLTGRLFELVPRIDFIFRSEPDLDFPLFVTSLLAGRVSDELLATMPNLVWRDSGGQVIENPPQLPSDLDALGFPAWELMKPADFARFTPHGGFAKGMPVAQLMTTRGCPYACSFCSAELIHGKRIRRRSAESIVEEIEYLGKDFGVREYHFEDDNFTASKKHAISVCGAIRDRGIKAFFTLPNGVRIDRLDDEVLDELHATGFYALSLGIESGSQDTLERMNKALDLGKVRETIARIRKYDFQVRGYFIIGYPGETREDIVRTIEYARSLDLDKAYFTMYIPLPGTDDFRMLEERGDIDLQTLPWDRFFTKGKTDPPYVPEGLTSEEMDGLAHVAYRRFYARPKIMYGMWRDLEIQSVKHFGEIVWNAARMNLAYFI